MSTENNILARQFENLFNGEPWLDITILQTLHGLSPEKAAEKKSLSTNSIWEITNHIIAWRWNVLMRVKGEVIQTPSHNYFEPVTDTSPAAWKETQKALLASQEAWLNFFEAEGSYIPGNIYPTNNMTHRDHVHGIIQHDAYHLGQIVMLSKH